MPRIQQQRSGNDPLAGFFEKVKTDGDIYRFLGAESGKREATEVTSPVSGPGPGDVTITSFQYLVGQNQLQVIRLNKDNPLDAAPVLDKATAEAIFDEENPSVLYFEETDESTYTLYNVPAGNHIFLAMIPHTSVPAEIKSKVVVANQGKNAAVELLGNGDGIILRSGSGFKYLLRVDDSGNLVTSPL